MTVSFTSAVSSWSGTVENSDWLVVDEAMEKSGDEKSGDEKSGDEKSGREIWGQSIFLGVGLTPKEGHAEFSDSVSCAIFSFGRWVMVCLARNEVFEPGEVSIGHF